MASITWRIHGVDTGGAALVLSQITPWSKAGAVTPLSITSSFAPVSGAINNLLVDDSTHCTFAAADVRQPGFAIEFTFAAAVDLWGFRFAGPSADTWPMQHSVSAGALSCSLNRLQWVLNALSPAPTKGLNFVAQADVWTAQVSAGVSYWTRCAVSGDGQTALVAANASNLWLSKDAGATWIAQAAAGSRDWRVCAVSADGLTLLGAAYNDSLWLSKDAGATWIAQTAAGSRDWRGCAISADGLTLLGAAYNGSLWLSKDAGATWVAQTAGANQYWSGCAVSADGRTLLGCVSGYSLWLSKDAGATWVEQTATGSKPWRGCAVSADGQTLLGVAFSGNLWLSKDAGTTWVAQLAAANQSWTGCAASGDGRVLLGSAENTGSLWLSKDAGATWVAQTAAGGRDWRGCAVSADGLTLLGAAYLQYLWLYNLADPVYLARPQPVASSNAPAALRSDPLPQGQVPTQKLAAPDKLLDTEFGGVYRIYGTVARKSTPANLPLKRRVRLHRSKDGYLVRETWSKADGSYAFTEISGRYEYDVIAWDHEMQDFSTVANNQLAEPMP